MPEPRRLRGRGRPSDQLPGELMPAGAYGDLESGLESEDGSFHGLFWSFLRLVRRRRLMILAVTVLGAIAGVASRLPRAPRYRTTVSLEIQAVNEDFGFSKDVNPTSNMGSVFPDIELATQAQIIRSKAIQDRVIAKLAGDRGMQIQFPQDRLAELLAAVHLARPKAVSPDPHGDASRRMDMIADAVQSLQVSPARTTRIMTVTCESTDPALAAAAANTIASEYIDSALESRWQAAKHTGEWLGRQLDDMKLKLEKSEEQLQSYAQAMSLVVAGSKDNRSNVSDEKLRQLQSELSVAEADRVSKQARYEMASSSRAESLGQVLDDTTLRTYESKLADLRKEMADLQTTLTPAHPKVRKVQAQIAEMESAEKSSRDRVVERIYNDYREAERREKLLAARYEGQSALVSDEAGKLIHYNLLQREVDTNRQLYESLLQKVKEAGISAALRASNIRVVDAAGIPTGPASPDVQLAGLLGLFLGLGSGLGLAVVREKVVRSIQVPGDALYYLNLPLLGAIPSRLLYKEPESPAGTVAGTLAPVVLNDFHGNRSVMAEAFRAILTSVLFAGRRQAAQVLVVGSPAASEGKTTVSCNLALAFAEANRSVLLIDCDMRRPRLHQVFAVPNEEGLAELLSSNEELDARSMFLRMHSVPHKGVTVLPSGRLAAGAANLLHSARFESLIEFARQHFDVVLLDTPPLLQVADARIVGALSDGVVLVIRAGQTMRDSAMAARQQLDDDGIPVLGVILNDWDPKSVGYYGYEYYGQTYYSNTHRGDHVSVS